MNKLLKRKEFKAWLKAKPKGAIIGSALHVITCPIARYLNEVFGAAEGESYWVVTGKLYFRRNLPNEVKRRMPGWAYRFILYIDRCSPSVTIRREDCLKALRKTRKR